ncbi:MAG: alpha/beta hydrolase [Rhodospirillaceae bacterium]
MISQATPNGLIVAILAICFSFVVSQIAQAEYKRGYVDTRSGQVHYYRATPQTDVKPKTPIIFLHPNGKSGQIFEYMIKEMGRDRIAVAFDMPGYGGSDPIDQPSDMTELAQIIADSIRGLGYGSAGVGAGASKVDIFGFHTGSVLATELSLKHPDLIRRIILSGIPLRTREQRKVRFDNVPWGEPISEDKVEYAWVSTMETRDDDVTIEDAAKTFSENIRLLVNPWWNVYGAVWTYPLEERLPELTVPTLVLNPVDGEFDVTRTAYERLLKNASYVELPQITNIYHPFTPEPYWRLWSDELRKWLDAPV